MRARASLLLLLCRALHAYEATADDDRTIPDGISCAAHEAIATFAAGCFWSVELAFPAGHKTVGSHLTFDQLLAKPNPKDDHGTQYRSEVFTHSAEQHEAATAWKRRLEVERGSPIVTAISPAPAFWPAEEYHQQFLEKGGQDASKGSAEAIKCYG